jgi:hypothetical protein
MRMIWYRIGEGSVKHMDRSAVRKMCRVRKFVTENPPYGVFRRRSILRNFAARPCRSSGCNPRMACFASYPNLIGGSTSKWLVVVQRAPCHCATNRLLAACSSARLPPLIRMYPPRRQTTHEIPALLVQASRCLVLMYKVAICHPST